MAMLSFASNLLALIKKSEFLKKNLFTLTVTGASFVVFNGALKTSSGLRAKSSIVEDGLMIQVLPETLASLKQALVDMSGFTIQCGPADTDVPEESVEVKWVENDKGFNLG